MYSAATVAIGAIRSQAEITATGSAAGRRALGPEAALSRYVRGDHPQSQRHAEGGHEGLMGLRAYPTTSATISFAASGVREAHPAFLLLAAGQRHFPEGVAGLQPPVGVGGLEQPEARLV